MQPFTRRSSWVATVLALLTAAAARGGGDVESIRALGLEGDRAALPRLAEHLGSPRDEVLEAAVDALAALLVREPAASADLAPVLERAVDPRRAAGLLAVLSRVDRAGAAGLAQLLLGRPDDGARGVALRFLALCGPAPEVDPAPVRRALLAALGDPEETLPALRALARWGDESCVLPILELAERRPHLGAPAVETLRAITGCDLRDVSSYWRRWSEVAGLRPQLEQLLASLGSPDTDAVRGALGRLARLPDPRTFEGLGRLAAELARRGSWGAPEEGRAEALCEAVTALGDRRGAPALLTLLEAPAVSDAVRARATAALGRITRHVQAPGGVEDAERREGLGAPPARLTAASLLGPSTQARAHEAVVPVAVEPRETATPPSPLAGIAVACAAAVLTLLLRRRVARRPAAAEVPAATPRTACVPSLEVGAPERPAAGRSAGPRVDEVRNHRSHGADATSGFFHVVLGPPIRGRAAGEQGAAEVAPMAEPPAPEMASLALPARASQRELGPDALLAALEELEPTLDALTVRLRDEELPWVWTRDCGEPLRDVLTALTAKLGCVSRVGVRLAWVGTELVLFDDVVKAAPAPVPPPPPRPVAASPPPAPEAWAGLVTAVEELLPCIVELVVVAADGESVELRPEDDGPEALLELLRGLGGVAVSVRARLVGCDQHLVLFEPPASPSGARPRGWRDLLRSIDALEGGRDSSLGLEPSGKSPSLAA